MIALGQIGLSVNVPKTAEVEYELILEISRPIVPMEVKTALESIISQKFATYKNALVIHSFRGIKGMVKNLV